MEISIEDWLAEMERLKAEAKSADGCLSMDEILTKINMGEHRFRRLLKSAESQGIITIEVKRRMVRRLDNVYFPIPVYDIKPRKKAAKSPKVH